MSTPLFARDESPLLEKRGLRDRVYDLVLARLMGSDFEPGTRLSIDQIARDLRVSPTPVREALVQLERTGLVTRVAHKGYRVAPPLDERQLEALFDARTILESGAAALAARSPESIVPLLEEAMARQEDVARHVRRHETDGEVSVALVGEYFDADWAFHRAIFESTANTFLLDMSEVITTRVHRMRQNVHTGITDSADALAEHRRILDAFSSGPDAVAAAMSAHIASVRTRSIADAQRD